MNKHFIAPALLVVALLGSVVPGAAQQVGQDPNSVLPVDPAVKVSTLPNGVRYVA
jgi:hypothetical protein